MEEKILPYVSIIVPVYNTEEYLNRCIESLVSQSLERIEIILVNDGSKDKSLSICEKWEKKDNRIKLINQENQGLSAARNAGLKVARGTFIGFVDSDDYIEKNMYQNMYQFAVQNETDMVSCKFIDCYNGVVQKVENTENRVLNPEETLASLLKNTGEFTAHMCNKLIHHSLITQEMFPVGKTYEDSHVIVELIIKSKRVGVWGRGEYYYFHREGSIVESEFSTRDYSLLEAWENNSRLIMEKFPELEKEVDYRYYWTYFYLLDKMLKEKKKNMSEIKKAVKSLKKNRKKILTNPYFNKSRKIGFQCLEKSLFLYLVLYKINRMKQRG